MEMITDPERPSSGLFNLVIPVFNESETIPVLLNELQRVFSPEALREKGISTIRYVFVDDGSSDDTASKIAKAINDGLPAKLVRLSRNFGHQAAVSAGLDVANGDVVAVIDADLQDPPEVILAMLELWRQGSDVVYAVRRNRKENVFKRTAYTIFYRLIALLTENLIPRDSGDFSVIDKRVVGAMKELPETLRFVRGIRAWVGFRQTPYEYDREERKAGAPKYNVRRLYRLATDGIISSSIRPLRLTQALAILFFLFSMIIGAGSVVVLFEFGASNLALTAILLLMAFCSVAFFLIFFCFYVLSSYVGRAYLETKGRPAYVVMEVLDGPRPSAAAQD